MHLTAAGAGEPRPWRPALAWLAFLGPFFFASYGLANWSAAQRAHVPTVVFSWELAVPFLPWTILPYWSIDLFYAASLFLCATRAELRVHVGRLLFVQIVAVLCFLVVPLRFSLDRPPAEGMYGALFGALAAFDLPFNQAPSLHVALLAVLWPVYLRALPSRWHALVHGWGIAIGISVLTTWQHHFIDVPTGAWLGCLAVWLVRPDLREGIWRLERGRDPVRRTLAVRYGAGAIALGSIAAAGRGGWLWLFWPAASLALVAIVQLFGDGRSYGKRAGGRFDVAAWVLFGPYFFGAWINARAWTRRTRTAAEIREAVHLGSIVRLPAHRHADGTAVVDLAAEIPRTSQLARDRCIPMLDLIPPTAGQLQEAALAIETARAHGPVLVACALGFSRSAVAVAAWLLHAGHADSVATAIALVRRARPAVVLGARHVEALESWRRAHAPACGPSPSDGSRAIDARGPAVTASQP